MKAGTLSANLLFTRHLAGAGKILVRGTGLDLALYSYPPGGLVGCQDPRFLS